MRNAFDSLPPDFSDFADPPNSTGTNTDDPPRSVTTSSFYLYGVPRNLVFDIIVHVLNYDWQIWLERTFPARPKGSKAASKYVKDKTGENEDVEEEIVKKWIAQGKVRRASISWCNTFTKWIIDLLARDLWRSAIKVFLRWLLQKDAHTLFTSFKMFSADVKASVLLANST